MAYTIIRSDGNVLATIQDGTINTTATSLGLPGRNYASYGQTLDTNLVRMLENFAKDTVPANPIRGQLWYNTNDSTLRICPADNTTTASNWVMKWVLLMVPVMQVYMLLQLEETVETFKERLQI